MGHLLVGVQPIHPLVAAGLLVAAVVVAVAAHRDCRKPWTRCGPFYCFLYPAHGFTGEGLWLLANLPGETATSLLSNTSVSTRLPG